MFDSKNVRSLRIILKELGYLEASKNAESIYHENMGNITRKIERFNKVTALYSREDALKDYLNPSAEFIVQTVNVAA